MMYLYVMVLFLPTGPPHAIRLYRFGPVDLFCNGPATCGIRDLES